MAKCKFNNIPEKLRLEEQNHDFIDIRIPENCFCFCFCFFLKTEEKAKLRKKIIMNTSKTQISKNHK